MFSETKALHVVCRFIQWMAVIIIIIIIILMMSFENVLPAWSLSFSVTVQQKFDNSEFRLGSSDIIMTVILYIVGYVTIDSYY